MSRTKRTTPNWTMRKRHDGEDWVIPYRQGRDGYADSSKCYPRTRHPKGYCTWSTAAPSDSRWASRAASKVRRANGKLEIRDQLYQSMLIQIDIYEQHKYEAELDAYAEEAMAMWDEMFDDDFDVHEYLDCKDSDDDDYWWDDPFHDWPY